MSDRHSIAARIASLWADRPYQDPRDVADVVLLCSSSRGGSSVLAEVLRASKQLRHLRGEINPWLRLAGIGGDDDALGPDIDTSELGPLLMRDVGQPAAWSLSTLAEDLAVRLMLQWGEDAPSLDAVERALAGCTAGLATELFAELVPAVGLDVRWYDLGVPAGAPPGAPMLGLEETPFVCVGPWRAADPRLPLLIKTPSNAYRLRFFRALFPNARLRVLHLTRNPGASVHGLVEGWRHWGFASRQLPRGSLSIEGYPSDEWWCFDVPPGWRAFWQRPLDEVAAFQWSSAHRAILDGSAELDTLVVPFETFTEGEAGRRATIARIAEWLRLPLEVDALAASAPPLVMATSQPERGRWRRHRAALAQGLADRMLQDIARRLGYHDESEWP